jgi:hypothetical protein
VTRIISKPAPDHAGTIHVGADDPQATTFACQIDDQPQKLCSSEIKVRRGIGKVMRIRAGGPGMLFDEDTANVRLSHDSKPPTITISSPGGGALRVLRGRARDASGIRQVLVALSYGTSKGCRYLVSRTRFTPKSTPKACSRVIFVPATGTRTWRLRLPHAVRGRYVIIALAIDGVGNRSAPVDRGGRTG